MAKARQASDHELRQKKSFKLGEHYNLRQRNYINVNEHKCRECKLKLLTNIAVRLSSKAHHLYLLLKTVGEHSSYHIPIN